MKQVLGIMVDKVWKESMVDAKTIGDKILAIKLMRAQEKFWEDVEGLVQGIPQQKRIFLCEDLNGHVGSQKRHFTNAHGFGDLNEKGQTIFYFSMAFDLLLFLDETISNSFPSYHLRKSFRKVLEITYTLFNFLFQRVPSFSGFNVTITTNPIIFSHD